MIILELLLQYLWMLSGLIDVYLLKRMIFAEILIQCMVSSSLLNRRQDSPTFLRVHVFIYSVHLPLFDSKR
jgi:hypothetical protein